MAKSLGATHCVLIPSSSSPSSSTNNNNHSTFLHEYVKKEVCNLTRDKDGGDITVDAAGYPSTSEYAVYCTRPGGKMIQVGLPISGDNGGKNVDGRVGDGGNDSDFCDNGMSESGRRTDSNRISSFLFGQELFWNL